MPHSIWKAFLKDSPLTTVFPYSWVILFVQLRQSSIWIGFNEYKRAESFRPSVKAFIEARQGYCFRAPRFFTPHFPYCSKILDPMKTSCLAVLFLSSTAVWAQTTTAGNQAQPPKPAPYSIVQRDANSRVWERYIFEKAPDGTLLAKPHRIIELATGMNYLKQGQWVSSQEQINVLAQGGAEAVQGQHQAYFPGDIYKGVVQLVTPDGKRLKGSPVGISYDDGQNTVLIAQLTNSVGILVSPNQVVYPDAFTGIKADLVYTYRKGGFEQDVVLRDQPPSPESLGLNASVKLQLLTEFTGSPEPAQQAAMANGQDSLQDVTLTFGGMQMVQGRAFSINDSAGGRRTKQTPTYKSWLHLHGRTFLVEELPYERIAPQLEQLPTTSRIGTRKPISSRSIRSWTRFRASGCCRRLGRRRRIRNGSNWPDWIWPGNPAWCSTTRR